MLPVSRQLAVARQSNGTDQSRYRELFQKTDIGIRRDTASASFRWVRGRLGRQFDYSHMHREGTQVDGVVFWLSGYFGVSAQVPKPVDDTTQNFGLNGEYAARPPGERHLPLKLATPDLSLKTD